MFLLVFSPLDNHPLKFFNQVLFPKGLPSCFLPFNNLFLILSTPPTFLLPLPLHLYPLCVIIPTYYFCPRPSLVMSLSVASCSRTYRHTCTQACSILHIFSCTCTDMEVIKARSKVGLITQLQQKLLWCFMPASKRWWRGAGGGERGGTTGVQV